jgi:hypothetical protein
MRTFAILAGTCAALIALPASAQLAGTLGGTVNTGVGAATSPVSTGVNSAVGAGVNATVNTAQTTGTVLDTAGRVTSGVNSAATRTVDATQRVTDRTLTAANLTLATRQQVQTGLVVRDMRGQRIGTVSAIDANTAIVVSGNREYRVPLSALYHRTSAAVNGAASGLVTSIPRARLSAHVTAHAHASSAAHAGN